MGSNQVALWLGLNLLDLVLSIVSLNYGALEANLIPRWMRQELGLIGYALYRLGLVALIPLLLARVKKLHLLQWLNIGMGCICLYLIVMLIKTFS